jgi:Amt family ammonium transporter
MAGDSTFFIHQLVAVVGTCIYAFLFTYVMLALINMLTKVKVGETEERQGLDVAIHGENAYDAGVF